MYIFCLAAGIIWFEMGESSAKLGKAIQSARHNAAMTQQALCHEAKLSYSTLAKIERGAIKTPSAFTVYRIAQALNISMDDLMGAVVDAKHSSRKKTSKSGTQFVYFDINGCLVRFFHGAFTHIAQDTGVPSDRIESAFWHLNDSACKGEITMQEFNTKLAQHLGIASIDWTEYYLKAIEPIQEMHDLLSWTAQHYKVGLLSNIMPGQVETMIQKAIIPNIQYDAIIDSSQVKAIKPNPDIYQIAEQNAGVDPSAILFVDDSRTNLMAAERRGWKVLWFDDFSSLESANKIRSSLEF